MSVPSRSIWRSVPVWAITSSMVLFFFAQSTAAQEQRSKAPHWSAELKIGAFYPDLDEWSTFYGDDHTLHFAGSLAYKVHRQVEIGAEVGFIKDEGEGLLPSTRTLGGRVTYRLYPVHLFVLWRGIFNEDQLLVPYLGGGWTRAFYNEEIDDQADRDGKADGWNLRAGLQVLLDRGEPASAQYMQQNYGLDNTYLFFEFQSFSAEVQDTDLGGNSYLLGVLFEF